MNLRDIVIVGVAVAMDALAVTLSIGLSNLVNRRKKIMYIISFAFFQYLLFFLGGVSGFFFEKYIVTIPHLIGGIIIGIVGLIMIKEGFEDDKDEAILLKKFTTIILGISVSIDALVVGFTAFHHLPIGIEMFLDSTLVGIITLIICTVGFYLCRYIRKVKFFRIYADFLGGIILILFALKMIMMK